MKFLDELDSVTLSNILIWVAIGGFSILAIAIAAYSYNFSVFLSETHENWGQFGDYLGGTLSPIFSFLALIALLLTIIIQSSELKLSRRELKNSVSALREQNSTLTAQKNERKFFQLIEFHNSLVNSIHIETRRSTSAITLAKIEPSGWKSNTGRECFKIFYGRLEYHAKDLSKKNQIVEDPEPDISSLNHEEFNEAFDKFYELNESLLGHYFRSLQNIAQFTHRSFRDELFYINVLKSQLSSYELLLTFYYLASNQSNTDFQNFASTYGLLESCNLSLLFDESHREYISQEAFQVN